jgi:DNA-binding response OmpR family regulator
VQRDLDDSCGAFAHGDHRWCATVPTIQTRLDPEEDQMGNPMVLVVDDQPEYARLISLSLAREGFEVRTARDGEEAIETASLHHPDVVLLDVNMPGPDGYAVMVELRERWPVPIIMVTGNGSLEQRRDGLDRGADDYVTKPFSPQELGARVRALLRRSAPGGRAVDEPTVGSQDPGPTASVSKRMGRRAARLLELLAGNPGKVLYRDELLAHAFGPAFVGDRSLLQEEIRRLRRALGIRANEEGPIRTVRGLGYRFVPGDEVGTPRAHRARPARLARS